ncbi:hypothetical protein [Borrelia sp. RT1S]|uniref:hypothetical protein n=1 Tax=Borrelia sp. RT1S TaxID=2898580 RepID=UPI001E35622B|nr:hypothetical protein [Borrelia sp. RT1S]UGQ17979.1 hypothetical protein LSO05_05965 [Borrelia sp. RT1S]
MMRIGILFVSLSVVVFGCRLYIISDDSDTPEARERVARQKADKNVVSLEKSLDDVLGVLYAGNGATSAKQKAFFEWLKDNDSDYSKRKEIADAMEKVYGLIKGNAGASKEIEGIIEKGQNDEGMKRAGLKSPSDLKSDEQVDALVKYVGGTDDEWTLPNGDSSSIKTFFGELGAVFDDDLASAAKDRGEEKERSNEEVFEDLKKVFSDEDSDPFDVLKSALEETE